MSGFQVVGQVKWLYHLNTGHPLCPVFKWIGVWYSDGYCTLIIYFVGDRNWHKDFHGVGVLPWRWAVRLHCGQGQVVWSGVQVLLQADCCRSGIHPREGVRASRSKTRWTFFISYIIIIRLYFLLFMLLFFLYDLSVFKFLFAPFCGCIQAT